MRIETVRIKADNEQGFIIINKSDLTLDQQLFDAEKLVDEVIETKPKRVVKKKAQ